jgi:hypothetical protein
MYTRWGSARRRVVFSHSYVLVLYIKLSLPDIRVPWRCVPELCVPGWCVPGKMRPWMMHPWNDASLGWCVPRKFRPLRDGWSVPYFQNGDGWSILKNGNILSQYDQDKTSQGSIILGTHDPRDASSHFFQGRIVQGRNVRAPISALSIMSNQTDIAQIKSAIVMISDASTLPNIGFLFF